MKDKEIREMLNNLGYGENPPERLNSIISLFRKRKSAVFPEALTVSDVVFCTIIYDISVGKSGRKAD